MREDRLETRDKGGKKKERKKNGGRPEGKYQRVRGKWGTSCGTKGDAKEMRTVPEQGTDG